MISSLCAPFACMMKSWKMSQMSFIWNLIFFFLVVLSIFSALFSRKSHTNSICMELYNSWLVPNIKEVEDSSKQLKTNKMFLFVWLYQNRYLHGNSIQIMNVYECICMNIFMRWKMKCWMVHFIFHQMKIFVPLHKWENIHYLFYITCTLVQRFKFLNKFLKKPLKNDFSSSKTFYKPYYMDACITLNARTVPVAFAPRSFTCSLSY